LLFPNCFTGPLSGRKMRKILRQSTPAKKNRQKKKW